MHVIGTISSSQGWNYALNASNVPLLYNYANTKGQSNEQPSSFYGNDVFERTFTRCPSRFQGMWIIQNIFMNKSYTSLYLCCYYLAKRIFIMLYEGHAPILIAQNSETVSIHSHHTFAANYNMR